MVYSQIFQKLMNQTMIWIITANYTRMELKYCKVLQDALSKSSLEFIYCQISVHLSNNYWFYMCRPFEGAPWVYGSFGDHRPKCYLSGFQGPCPLNMKLYPQSSSYYGYCDCSCKEYFGNKINVPRAYCIGSGPELNSKRILAFDKVSDTCHILFKQVILICKNSPAAIRKSCES